LFNQEPDNILGPESLILQNEYDGDVTTTIPLGVDEQGYASEQPRDDEDLNNCTRISPTIPNKREGLCNDGIYTIKTQETDTAGNTGDWIERSIERDTVRPDTPSVVAGKTGNIFQEYLSIDVTGEAFTSAEIKVTSDYGYDNTFTRDLVTTGECPRCSSSGNGRFVLPVTHPQTSITGEFPRYKISTGLPHAGMDFAAPFGTPIFAVSDGTVRQVVSGFTDNYGKAPDDPNWDNGWGNHVIIDHGDGIQTIYAHLSLDSFVSEGQVVYAGQVIGEMGSTGSSTGSHLHFQVEVEGAPLNPLHQGKYNKYPPANPRLFFGEITTNLTDEQVKTYCNYDGDGGVVGSAEYPWGGVELEDLGELQMLLRKDKNGNIETLIDPRPSISYVDTLSYYDTGEFEVYGLGLYKYSDIEVIVYEEVEVCNTNFFFFQNCSYEWTEKTKFREAVDHAEILLTSESGAELDQLWNDDPPFTRGKWKSDRISAGGNINYNEKVCVESRIYGFTGEGDNWWDNFDYGGANTPGNCRILIDYLNFDIDEIINRVQELTDEGKTDTQEYRDLIDALANATSAVSDIISKSYYIDSSGAKVDITVDMWVQWANQPGTQIDPNTKIFVKNGGLVGELSNLLSILGIALAAFEDINNQEIYNEEGLVNPAPLTTSALLSFGAGYYATAGIFAICTLATAGACAVIAIVGGIVASIVVGVASEFIFTEVLTESNIESTISNMKKAIPRSSKEEVDWVINLCLSMGGSLACGSNPYEY
jgi:murein DD-endopeptidase MepM/ murein hydrolase activator NlpD